MRPRYLFKRKNSENWYLRLQPPGEKVIEKSLHTSDVKLAELAAHDLIKQHKANMYARRAAYLHELWQPELEPGLHALPDGGHVLATERQLTYTDASGKIVTVRPNGGPAFHLTGRQLPARLEFKTFDDAYNGVLKAGIVNDGRPKPAVKNGDDGLLELYFENAKNGKVTGSRRREAEAIWHLFKTVVGKPLRDCDRNDGRDVVAYLKDQAEAKGQTLTRATLHRKLVPLVAMANFAVQEGRLRLNPFVGVLPPKDDDDSTERLAFDDDDMAAIKANLHRLGDSDQLLIRLLASTGARLGEALQIDREQSENGCRFVIVGTKTAQSKRRVPFATDLLPHLPDKIKGPLFTGDANAASKRLNAFLRECGIKDSRKVLHSFRHRAADRLRAGGVPEDLRWAVLGHHKKTADKYGKGFPVTMLREAIDKIGGL